MCFLDVGVAEMSVRCELSSRVKWTKQKEKEKEKEKDITPPVYERGFRGTLLFDIPSALCAFLFF